MPVQRCTLTLPIPLLPLCAVRPVQSVSACTKVHFTYFTLIQIKFSVFILTIMSYYCVTKYLLFNFVSTPCSFGDQSVALTGNATVSQMKVFQKVVL